MSFMGDPAASLRLFQEDFGAWLERNGVRIPDVQFRRKDGEPEHEHRKRLSEIRLFDAEVDLTDLKTAIWVMMKGDPNWWR